MPTSALGVPVSDSTALTASAIFVCVSEGSEDCWASDDPSTMQLAELRDATLAASDPIALVDYYNTLFMAGQMSPAMRNILIARLSLMSGDDYGDELGLRRVEHALYLILNSPEYSIQK